MWSLKFEKCVKCGTKETRHAARGLCVNCYAKDIEEKHKSHVRKRRVASKMMTRRYLIGKYIEESMSLSDIARECSCTRQYVYKKMKEYKIPLRSQRCAREIAYDQGKIVVEITDDAGKSYSVIHKKIELDKAFFSSWSAEMAYVLGVLFTDGCLLEEKRKSRGSTGCTRIIPRLSLGQKEPELIRKILALMKCNARIYYRKRIKYKNTVAGELYVFDIMCSVVYDDLINLGLKPVKSLNIEFPDVPPEYMRHFIRGCWDGDGSAYISGDKLRASYVSGSKDFIETLVQEFFKIGISMQHLIHGRDIKKNKETRCRYRSGPFPLTIHKSKRSKAASYYITVSSKENLMRLFHYFYDDVENSMYLKRKYEVLKKGLSKSDQEQGKTISRCD